MKLTRIRIHNFRSIIDSDIEVHDFTMLVGANNAGKSNFINALRCFYGELKWNEDDFPKRLNTNDDKSWVELHFDLTNDEWQLLDAKYKNNDGKQSLVLKRHFKGDKVKPRQNNIYAIVNDEEQDEVFYGVKTNNAAMCGKIIYIPALTNPDEQMKTSGPSPLREMLNFILKTVLPQNTAYNQLKQAFQQLNEEAYRDNGFLSTIAQPINNALSQWNIQLDLSVNPPSPEGITKSLINYSFTDLILGNSGLSLDRFGHGFQRAVIYELIRLASGFQEQHETTQNEFNPDFTLLLFEEPEAFLHPTQQENMAYHLRELSQKRGQQIIITSHSPVFVSKNSDDISQICRIHKSQGISEFYQLKQTQKENLIGAGGDFLNVLRSYVANPEIEEKNKENARKLIKAPPKEIARQYEQFRFQIWLESDRAAMFFADKVLLVEGTTEKMLFNYLLANDWHDLTGERILIVDALGKYNFHRFIKLFETFGIRHGIMLDNDNNNNEHAVINQLIRDRKNKFTLADPFEFDGNLEKYLGLSIPNINERKPLQILLELNAMKFKNIKITKERLTQLREVFCNTLAIHTNKDQ